MLNCEVSRANLHQFFNSALLCKVQLYFENYGVTECAYVVCLSQQCYRCDRNLVVTRITTKKLRVPESAHQQTACFMLTLETHAALFANAAQYSCQHGVVVEIGRKAEEELAKQIRDMQNDGLTTNSSSSSSSNGSSSGAYMSRQEAARLRATHAKLTKVSQIAEFVSVVQRFTISYYAHATGVCVVLALTSGALQHSYKARRSETSVHCFHCYSSQLLALA
jgi:hypothetical protein